MKLINMIGERLHKLHVNMFRKWC